MNVIFSKFYLNHLSLDNIYFKHFHNYFCYYTTIQCIMCIYLFIYSFYFYSMAIIELLYYLNKIYNVY